ncbi:hypothetical protein WICMUC_000849 [Wickerhamomyces mucosus]|uniref:non-specific serine/threonine protein kinase n=1 Tax=Wickerhamomyces mucosus TaxID=1378264 RepID=A0A9P8PXV9_9ASCO|nr:hypothetical protein WICMUC_000849 [Wickerhamomyces mucosus]
MDPNASKLELLDKFKEGINERVNYSMVEENELLRSPKFKRLQSSSPPRSSSSSPSKSSSNNENNFDMIPNLQFKPNKELLKTPTKPKLNRKPSKQQISNQHKIPLKPFNGATTLQFSINSPVKHNGIQRQFKPKPSNFDGMKVSLTPAQRLEKKSGRSLTTNDILSSYEFKETIGRGAFANVYRAINKKTGDEVAIKEIFIEDDDDILELMSEIDLLKILRHKNIVKYHGFVRNEQKLLIFLEYCSGGSLRSLYKNSNPLSEDYVVTLLIQVINGLIYLHGQGVVHRDVKAANILLTNTGDVKLTDFGVSTKVSTKTIKTYSIAGTPNWMAPEIISMDGTSTASDIWSLGATVVELLTGEPLYSNLNEMAALHAIVTDEFPPIPENISNLCRDFLIQCFEKQPAKRITARELSQHPWLNQKTTTAHSEDERNQIKNNLSQVELRETARDFNSIKRFNTRKYLPSSNIFKHAESNLSKDELSNDFKGLTLNNNDLKCSVKLFEPIAKSTIKSQSFKHLLIAKDFQSLDAIEAIQILKRGYDKEICNEEILLKLLQSIERKTSLNKIITVECLVLLQLVLMNDKKLISSFVNLAALPTLIKILQQKNSLELRGLAADILSLCFKDDPKHVTSFIHCGGLKITLKFLDIVSKSNMKQVMLIIEVLYTVISKNLLPRKDLQLIISSSDSFVEGFIRAFQKVVECGDHLKLTDKIIYILINFHTARLVSLSTTSLKNIFMIYENLSRDNQLLILKFLKTINVNDLDKDSQLLQFLVSILKTLLDNSETIVIDNFMLNSVCSFIFSYSHLDRGKQLDLIRLGVLSRFQKVINLKLASSEYIIPLVCEFAFNSEILKIIWTKRDMTLLQNYSELLLDPVWQANALDSLLSLHEKIGNDVVSKYLLKDKYQNLIQSFLVDESLNYDLYLQRLIRFFHTYSKSIVINQIRLLFFNNSTVIDAIFKRIKQYKSDLVIKINLFKLLKILVEDNFNYENYIKVSNYLSSIPKTNILLIDQLIAEMLNMEKEKENSLMRPPLYPNKTTSS